ncbi:Rieske 2Fe-2S domain-containing protein [Spirosoma sordidisoli]|uniref:(2Fe-2S)-binding protein n=1 Tax=Spirosoma sordidisoli TaxID=2502893 RepID=A0A4Q2UIK1_9BACT|nr:Rieske 2Fe-2S domain-containing protein [Spirosoma sordidisoli]RYC69267.1 (2Fe-2S)-binding protein [Spirosoma sordidisoli]
MLTKPTNENTMDRSEFIRSLGLSSAALMSFYCLGTLTSCSGGGDDPAPGGGTTTPVTSPGLTGNAEASKGAISFTLDLTSTDFSKLKTQGEFVRVGDVLVANTSGNKYVAIQRLCSHERQDAVSYRLSSNDFGCSVHGSVFALDGSVKVAAGGPSQPAMKLYKTTLSTNGNSLQITA